MKNTPVNVAIVGLGYWGPNLLRNFNSLTNCLVKYVVDIQTEQLEKYQISYKNIVFTTNLDLVLNDNSIDAIVVATPVNTHYSIAKQALLKGKHVLVEKPMSKNISEAQELKSIAIKNNLILMVDHTLLYTGAVKKIQSIIDSGELGKINYYDSIRTNLGLFQPDVNVIWDLAPHDIAVLKYLISEKPYSVQTVGSSHNETGLANIAYLTINFESGLIAHFNCSWVSPLKVRQTIIGGDKKMLVYNDLEPKEKIRVYDMSYDLKVIEPQKNIKVNYKNGDVYTPNIDNTEALNGVANDFISCILKGDIPQSNEKLGIDVMEILEASQESINNKGREIIL